MTEAPRRGASIWKILFPIALMACLAALVVTLPMLRGDATGSRADRADNAASRPKPTTGTSPGPGLSSSRAEVHALARLEPEEGILRVGARQGARIEKLLVKEGDTVTAGAQLAVMEGHEQARLQVELAEAQKKDADRRRTLARDKLALERKREDRLKQERLDAQRQVVDLARRRLQASKDIYKTLGQAAQGKAKFDLDMVYFQAEGDSIKSELDLKELEVAQSLTDERRAVEDRQVDAEGPGDDVLETQIRAARAGLDQTTVTAPAAGRVLEVLGRAGELSAGALLYLGDVGAMAAVAEVDQADVPEVRVGDPAEALILGRKVAGRVTRVGRLVGKNTLASLDPRALQDRRTVAVTIRLDDDATAADYVNMEVEVTIRPQHGGTR